MENKLDILAIAAHPDDIELAGKPSRWNTLRVMRVLKRYSDSFQKM